MVHIDVKKLGWIPDGGGWRSRGRSETVRGRGIGYDHVHTAIDDHTRLAYTEVLPDEKGTTYAASLTRAAAFFAAHGIARAERILTDNARNYRVSAAFQQACTDLGEIMTEYVQRLSQGCAANVPSSCGGRGSAYVSRAPHEGSFRR